MNFVNKNTYNLSYLFLKSIGNTISLHKEIYVKYSLSRLYPISNEKMHYKKPDRFFTEIYRNISIYFPFSLFFEEITDKKDFRFLFSSRVNVLKENLQPMILRLGELSDVDNSQIIGKLLHKNGTHSQCVDRLSSRTKLQRRESDALTLQHTVNANERHQRLNPTTSTTVHDVGNRTTTSVPLRGLVQSWQATPLAQEPSITSVVYAHSSILQEMASHSHDNVFISARTVLDQRWQTRMLTTATMLTTLSERQVGTPTIGMPQSVYLTGDTQPALREGPAPIIKQTLGEATIGTTTHFHTASITNATHPFTVICRAGRMEPPRLSYAFAQPMGSMAQEERVVTKVHEKEVVKVVQQEVQSLMSSGSVVKYLSRTDYTHIADNVYSSLARRLLVEKERLGMR
jgi:hypothetical protein